LKSDDHAFSQSDMKGGGVYKSVASLHLKKTSEPLIGRLLSEAAK
jgi:hypothetical protein